MKPDNFHERLMRDCTPAALFELAARSPIIRSGLEEWKHGTFRWDEVLAWLVVHLARRMEELEKDAALQVERKPPIILKPDPAAQAVLAEKIRTEVARVTGIVGFKVDEEIKSCFANKAGAVGLTQPAQMPAPPAAVCSQCQLPFTPEQPAVKALFNNATTAVVCLACYEAILPGPGRE